MAQLKDFGYQQMRVNNFTAVGQRPLLVILADVTGMPFAHSIDYYKNQIFNWGQKSLNGYLFDNSNERFLFRNAGIIGPVKLSAAEAMLPVEQRLGRIKELAIQSGFDFSRFDTNGDNIIDTHELTILVLDNANQDAVFKDNTVPADPIINSKGTRLSSGVAIVGDLTENFSFLVHEMVHTLGPDDLYFGVGNLGNFQSTLMGAEFADWLCHLDPWDKMALGWIEPLIYDIGDGNKTFELTVPGLFNTDNPVILYDKSRNTKEYFMIEYRSRNAKDASIYDNNVADNGLVIWHIVPDGTPNMVKTFTRGMPGLEPGSGVYWHADETTPYLNWIDGTSTGIKLHVQQFGEQDNSIFVDLICYRINPPRDTPYIRWFNDWFGVDVYGRIIVKPPGSPDTDELNEMVKYFFESDNQETRRQIEVKILKKVSVFLNAGINE